MAATRKPRFYESGQDVTGIDDPLTSYRGFIDRVIREYDNLSTIFKFVTVNAEEAVYRQHQHVRAAGRRRERRPWPEFSAEAITEWLRARSQLTRSLRVAKRWLSAAASRTA